MNANNIRYSKLVFLIILCAFTLLAKPALSVNRPEVTITFPSKDPCLISQTCDDPHDDCIFNLTVTFAFDSKDAGQNVTKAEYRTNVGDPWVNITGNCGQLPNVSGNCTFNFQRNVSCPGTDKFDFEVRITDADGTDKEEITFKLSCIEEEKQVGMTPGFPPGCLPYSNNERVVTCAYNLINTDSLDHTYQVFFSQSLDWLTIPLPFPYVTLAEDQDTTLYFDVIIPGGTIIGTENAFYFTAVDVSDEATMNSDTSYISICNEIPSPPELVFYVSQPGDSVDIMAPLHPDTLCEYEEVEDVDSCYSIGPCCTMVIHWLSGPDSCTYTIAHITDVITVNRVGEADSEPVGKYNICDSIYYHFKSGPDSCQTFRYHVEAIGHIEFPDQVFCRSVILLRFDPIPGACCLDDVCELTTTDFGCNSIGGNWSEGETCPEFDCLANYEYLPGDANMYAGQWPPIVIGADVTYLVNYFRGISFPCILDGFYASGDANGDCAVIGSDVTYLVQYFRGANTIRYCPDYQPAWPSPSDLPPSAPSGWPNCE